MIIKRKVAGALLAALIAAGALLGGCGKSNTAQQSQAVSVKTMKVIKRDTPVSFEYAGQVSGTDEVKIQPRVSGTIIEKYIQGGQSVSAGQPLFKIDQRQYESDVLSARAALAQSEATLNNAVTDLNRFEKLLAADAIAEQTVTSQRSTVQQYQAIVEANAALLKKAQENLDDTIVCSPMDGRVDVNDVAVGTYAKSGDTVLVSVGTIDPVYVRFSISETEYLRFQKLAETRDEKNDDRVTGNSGLMVTITLSNGEQYAEKGMVVQTDRALSETTGTLAVKAIFPNPKKVLLPGMFARVKLGGEVIKGALLIPERAIQQLLDKTFVNVVGADGKSETRAVVLGDKVGSYQIVKSGITENDTIIVEGLTRLQNGMELKASMVEGKDLGLTFDDEASKKTGKVK